MAEPSLSTSLKCVASLGYISTEKDDRTYPTSNLNSPFRSPLHSTCHATRSFSGLIGVL